MVLMQVFIFNIKNTLPSTIKEIDETETYVQINENDWFEFLAHPMSHVRM